MSTTPALAEWERVCAALCAGAVIATVRKGGIHERGGGLFAPRHERFWLLPTREHQRDERLSPRVAVLPPLPAEAPGTRAIPGRAEVAHVWKLTHSGQLDALADELPLTVAEARARFHYRDEPWLYLLILRVWRFDPPVVIEDRPAYAGCRSWLALAADPSGPEPVGVPVVPEAEFLVRRTRIAALVSRQ